jgi:transposase
MFSLTSSLHFYLYQGSTDMRKSFDALSGLVATEMERQAMSGDVFIFINRQHNKIKLLHWEWGGFVLYYKRLESGTFELPIDNHINNTYQIKWTDLVMIIDGISMRNIKKRKRFNK